MLPCINSSAINLHYQSHYINTPIDLHQTTPHTINMGSEQEKGYESRYVQNNHGRPLMFVFEHSTNNV